MKLFSSVFLLFCVIAVGLYLRKDRAPQEVDRDSAVGQMKRCETWHGDLLHPTASEAIDDITKKQLTAVYTNLALAYSQRNGEILEYWLPKLPVQVAKIPDDVFDGLERPLLEVVMGEWFWRGGSPLLDFPDAKTAECFISVGLSGVRLICDARLIRRKYGTCFDVIEAVVLSRLKKYQNKFKAVNNLDVAKVFSTFIDEWVQQIESDMGYTRTCVARDIELMRLRGRDIMSEHNQTWKQVVHNIIKQDTFALVSEGYTPRWVVEFENIPEPNW